MTLGKTMTNEEYARKEALYPMGGVIAALCEGALYCAEHLFHITVGEVEDGHVVLVSTWDVRHGTAAWVDTGCCSSCGVTWDEFGGTVK